MKIAAVVILYNPVKEVIENIKSYSPFVDHLFVIDNSEKQQEDIVSELSSISNTIYFGDGDNKGIAIQLNKASKLAIEKDCKWLLTMDQDSYFNSVDILNYIKCISSYHYKEDIAMFGIEYVHRNSQSDKCVAIECEQMITSGSVLNLSLFELIGGFDEALFIDEVDLEFCYKSILKGFKIIKFENIFLNHSLGVKSKHKSLKSLKTTLRTLHSPRRIYYMIRNFLYVNAKYKDHFTEDKKKRKQALLNRLKNNLLYGKNRFLLIKLIFVALKDYANNNMGKKY